MRLRIISINRNLFNDRIEHHVFDSLPSISDYDALIIDPKNLLPALYRQPTYQTNDGSFVTDTRQDKGHGRRIISLNERRAKEIGDLLAVSQGIVICYSRREEKPLVIRMASGSRYVDNYSWLPVILSPEELSRPVLFRLSDYISFQERAGTEVKDVDNKHPFSQFFKAFKNDILFESIIEIAKGLQPLTKVIALNKVKEVISCEITMGAGKVIFLPAIKSTDPAMEAGVLIDCIKKMVGRAYATPPPQWINNYLLPGESAHEADIEKLAKEISAFAEKRNLFIQEQEKIAKLKGLLYEKGKLVLESLVRDAFRILGFNVLEPDGYPEEYDLYIKGSNFTIVGEVEGTDTSKIDNDKVRQLMDYVDQEKRKGIMTKGILIGNSQRGVDPAKREGQFTSAAIDLAKRLEYCLLNTHQLYELIRTVLSTASRDEIEKIRQRIFSCVGEYNPIG